MRGSRKCDEEKVDRRKGEGGNKGEGKGTKRRRAGDAKWRGNKGRGVQQRRER